MSVKELLAQYATGNKFENEVAAQFPNMRYEITDDFVGVFDGLFTPEYCRTWREHFDKLFTNGYSHSRSQYSPFDTNSIDDESVDMSGGTFYTDDEWSFACPVFDNLFWNVAHKLYANRFSILKTGVGPYKAYTLKTQLTKPGGGYHVWHTEATRREDCNRVLVFILYLNTIKDGGETEFLYQKRRIEPVEGRLVIWPSGFTHTHRGNPPLKDNKYIVTGWLEF